MFGETQLVGFCPNNQYDYFLLGFILLVQKQIQ